MMENPINGSELPIIIKITGDGEMPQYATENSAGVDLKAHLPNKTISLWPGETVLVPTGLHMELPPGYEAQVRPRSGLALKHNIKVLNTPGTIDADYRGEVCVILHRNFTYNELREPSTIKSFVINEGDRIAQLVVAKLPLVEFVKVENLTETERGEGGFGHTGIK